MKFLLDTNIISEFAKPRPNNKVLNWLQQHENQCLIPSIAVSERYQGAYAQIDPKRKAVLLDDIKCLNENYSERIANFDVKAAESWGEYVNRDCIRAKPKSWPDTQIAAIALSRQLIIITRNVDDFPEVQTYNPYD